MEKIIENCGMCPLRQGNYICLGLERSKDENGVKHHIGREEHHIQPDWCPLPIMLCPAEGVEEEQPLLIRIEEEGVGEQEMGILHQMATMIQDGVDLTADKIPESPALSALVGFAVSAEWRDDLMKRIKVMPAQESPPKPGGGAKKKKKKKKNKRSLKDRLSGIMK